MHLNLAGGGKSARRPMRFGRDEREGRANQTRWCALLELKRLTELHVVHEQYEPHVVELEPGRRVAKECSVLNQAADLLQFTADRHTAQRGACGIVACFMIRPLVVVHTAALRRRDCGCTPLNTVYPRVGHPLPLVAREPRETLQDQRACCSTQVRCGGGIERPHHIREHRPDLRASGAHLAQAPRHEIVRLWLDARAGNAHLTPRDRVDDAERHSIVEPAGQFGRSENCGEGGIGAGSPQLG